MPVLRYEFIQFGAGRTPEGVMITQAELSAPLRSGFLAVETTPTPSAGQPVAPTPSRGGDVFLRLTNTGLNALPALASVGSAPDPAAEPRLLLVEDQTRIVAVRPGDRLAIMQIPVGIDLVGGG